MKNTIVITACVLMLPVAAGCSGGDGPNGSPTASRTAASATAPRIAPARPDRIGRARARASDERRQAQATGADAGGAADGPIPAKYQAFAAAFEAEMNSYGAPGAAVALLEHGEVTFAHGFGVKGPDSVAPVDAKTLFRYGSMNKALTATAMLGLIDEHKATLSDRVTSLIPGVALSGPDKDHVVLSDLLSQQSDLFDFTNFNLDPALSDFACPTGSASLGAFVKGPLFEKSEFFMAPPRSLWLYSNPNYVLTGAAIEATAGAYYADAMKSRVFAKLGMTRTFFDPNEVLADGNYTDGLSTNADGSPWDVAPDAYDCVWLRPAGLGFTSVLDYAKFVRFLYKGDTNVLSDESRELMQSPLVNMYVYGDNDSYGYGVEVRAGQRVIPQGFYSTKVVSHDGAIAGFSSIFYLVPETGFGFVAFGNTDGAYPYTSLLLALQSFSGLKESPKTPPNLDFDAGTSPRYSGTFDETSGILGAFTVSEDAGAFSIEMPTFDSLGVSYEPAMDDIAQYDFAVSIDSIPDAAVNSGAAIFLGQGFELSYVPGPSGRFDWVGINGALAAKRTSR